MAVNMAMCSLGWRGRECSEDRAYPHALESPAILAKALPASGITALSLPLETSTVAVCSVNLIFAAPNESILDES